jgi:hypothetical protein
MKTGVSFDHRSETAHIRASLVCHRCTVPYILPSSLCKAEKEIVFVLKQSRNTENRLLASLPQAVLNQLLQQMERFDLIPRRILHEADKPIEHVYFPEHGVVSLISNMKDGSVMEIATVGREGMIGLPIFLGADTSTLQAFPQVEGQRLADEDLSFQTYIGKRERPQPGASPLYAGTVHSAFAIGGLQSPSFRLSSAARAGSWQRQTGSRNLSSG